jgi:murein DD-endopeptidase MepM/ murein hydrolase activator NlpD
MGYGGMGAIALGAILLSGITRPSLSLNVQTAPASPRLGDTIILNLTPDPGKTAPSKVQVGSQTYPAFPIGNNRTRAMIPTTPLEKPGVRDIKVSADSGMKTIQVNVTDRKFPIQRINLPPGKAGVQATELELKKAAAFKAIVTPDKMWDGKFIPPNQGGKGSPYGVRRYYNGVFAKDYYHRGLDYKGGYGSPVVTPAGGKVALVGYEKQGFRVHGNVVGVDHGQGVVSIFLHLSKINVKEGQILESGDIIGAIGSTGASTGPHLHWGLYVNGAAVDPAQWLNGSIE